jgi:hypothetical protein
MEQQPDATGSITRTLSVVLAMIESQILEHATSFPR